MTHQIRKILMGSAVIVAALSTIDKANARTWYNFPSEAKVKITRDPDGQSWIYLEFLWGESGVPPQITKECVAGNSESIIADQAWEDPMIGYVVKSPFTQAYTVHNEWGRVQITMQTFNSSCDLGPNCDSVAKKYTCPHLIGASDGSAYGCQNVDKETDFWISRLCAPTDDYKFTPGYGEKLGQNEQSTACVTEQNSNDLYSHNACCIDLDANRFER